MYIIWGLYMYATETYRSIILRMTATVYNNAYIDRIFMKTVMLYDNVTFFVMVKYYGIRLCSVSNINYLVFVKFEIL